MPEGPKARVRVRADNGQKKPGTKAGLEKFGRGCLKGRLGMPPTAPLCKCETRIVDCNRINKECL